MAGRTTTAAACVPAIEYLSWHTAHFFGPGLTASPWLTGGAGAVQASRQSGAIEGPEEESREAEAGHGGQDGVSAARHKGLSRVLTASTCRPEWRPGLGSGHAGCSLKSTMILAGV